MKKQLLVICGMLVFLLVAWLPCLGQGIDNNAYLNQVYQQLADMGEYGMPYLFQNRNNGNGHGSQEEAVVDIYVNCSNGKDKPNWGLSPEKSFETINYAISRVPFIRKSTDYFANIHIAQGTYYDVEILNGYNIGLIGEKSENTHISVSEKDISIYITDSYNIIVDGITIENNNNWGIVIKLSVGRLSNSTIRNNGMGVVLLNSNFGLSNCDITNNASGLILDGAELLIFDKVSISSSSVGFALRNSKATVAMPCINLTISENYFGIIQDSSSAFYVEGGGIVIISDNTETGVSSDGHIMVGIGEMLVENNGAGISLGIQGHIEKKALGRLIIRDNLTTGLSSFGGDIVFSGGNVTIVDNPDRDLELSFGARAVFKGNTIGTLSCDETVLISGDVTCP